MINVRAAHPEMRASPALRYQLRHMSQLGAYDVMTMLAALDALGPQVQLARIVQTSDPEQMAALGRKARHETIDNLGQFMQPELLTPYDRKI